MGHHGSRTARQWRTNATLYVWERLCRNPRTFPVEDVVPDLPARVLLHVTRCYALAGRVTLRNVVETSGEPLSMVHDALVHLRERGLVTWEDGKAGTLRPTVAVVVLRRT